MMHVPTPIPSSTMTPLSVPRAAPNHRSAWPRAFAPLSTRIGRSARRRSTAPPLSLAEGLCAVVNENRQVALAAQHRLKGNGVPADALAMHDRVLAMLHQAGHADSDAKDSPRVHARLGDH